MFYKRERRLHGVDLQARADRWRVGAHVGAAVYLVCVGVHEKIVLVWGEDTYPTQDRPTPRNLTSARRGLSATPWSYMVRYVALGIGPQGLETAIST